MNNYIPKLSEYFSEEQLGVVRKNELFVYTLGVDQSINSTGVTLTQLISKPEDDEVYLNCYSYCIPAKDIKDFRDFINVEKYDKVQHADRSLTELESTKLENSQIISQIIVDLLNRVGLNTDKIKGVGLEGLSFNSKNKSASIYDLAGLNYIIRDRLTAYLKSNNVEYQQYVNVIAPMANKSRLVKGGVDKIAMWERFCEHLGLSKEINEKKESYLFDIVDSYSISRILILDYINDNFIPKVEKIVKEQPFKVIKRFKFPHYNFRLIEMNDGSNKRAVLSSNGEELPIKVLKSYPQKRVIQDTKDYINHLISNNPIELVDKILTKRKTKSKIIF